MKCLFSEGNIILAISRHFLPLMITYLILDWSVFLIFRILLGYGVILSEVHPLSQGGPKLAFEDF